MKPRITLLMLLLSVVLMGYSAERVDSLLSVLDNELQFTDLYIDGRVQHISALHQRFRTDEYDRYYALYQAYKPYQCDSALHYLDECVRVAKEQGLEAQRQEAILTRVYTYASCGMYHLAMQEAAECDTSLLRYQVAMQHLYAELAYFARTEDKRAEFNKEVDRYSAAMDRMLSVYDSDSTTDSEILLHLERRARYNGNMQAALHYSDRLLSLVGERESVYPIIAYERSRDFHYMGLIDVEKEWLIRSAIADVRLGITDNGSIWLVAQMCYDADEVNRAYRYITYSLRNCIAFNSAIRQSQIGPSYAIISRRYEEQQHHNYVVMTSLLIALVLLAILLIISQIVIYRKNHRLEQQHMLEKESHLRQQHLNQELDSLNQELRAINHQLQEANHVKEQYIAHYLNVYSQYIDRLYKLEKRPELLDEEMANFYQAFDSTFLSLYPDFVAEFNGLLRDGEELVLKKDERLNTELRIYALVKLGIDNTNQIADLLHYRANTIYNYRAKMKNKARGNRDDFEEQVKLIGTFVK